jgi:peptide/nickel transport system substrate-binding protein
MPATPWEAEIDRMIRVQSTEVQQAARKKAFDRIQQIVWEEEPFLYLVAKNALSAYRTVVGNASPSPLYPQMYWNADQLYVERGGR